MLPLADAKWLLQQATHLERALANLAERRQEFVQALGAAVDAKAGFWAWGRGRPFDSAVTPVAALNFGFASGDWPRLAQAALSEEVVVNFNEPVIRLLDESGGDVCVTRAMVWRDESWYSTGVFQETIRALSLDHFLVCVHYFSRDSWSNMTVFRQADQPDFTQRDRNLIEAALTSTAWMSPSAAETLSREAFVGLTHRQRAVMLLLLDGLARKEIAARLQITLHTVNDHVKALYSQFNVTSATELAAHFLRARE
jgi:DNA-binding CsgD family transcriptional regulator